MSRYFQAGAVTPPPPQEPPPPPEPQLSMAELAANYATAVGAVEEAKKHYDDAAALAIAAKKDLDSAIAEANATEKAMLGYAKRLAGEIAKSGA